MNAGNTYDVIVVGLGVIGSAALYQLAGRECRALGIDRFSPPHEMASSHGDTRITRQAVGEGPQYVPFVRRSNQIWRELEAATGQRLLLQSGGLIVCPQDGGAAFHGAHTNFVSRTAGIAEQNNIPHEVLTADATAQRFPMLNMRPNEHAYYEPGAGVIRPEASISALLDVSRERGAQVHTGETVLSCDATADGVSVRTDRATYHADRAIVAAGPWMNDFLPPELHSNHKVYRQVIYWYDVDDPAVFDEDDFPFLISIGDELEDFFSAFPIPHGGKAGLKCLTEEYADTTTPDAINRTVSAEKIDWFYERHVAPRMRGVNRKCLDAGVCMYTVTPDEHFIIDNHPDSERVIVASPCSGHGFKHAAAVGESLAQLALDGQTTLNIAPFSIARLAQ